MRRRARAVWLGTAALLPMLLIAAQSPDPFGTNAAMGKRLRAIYAATDWKADPNKPAQRVRYLSGLVESRHLTAEQSKVVLPELANEQLRAGDSRGALKTLGLLE